MMAVTFKLEFLFLQAVSDTLFLIFANVVYTGVFHLSSSQVRQLYSSEWFKIYMKIVILFFFFYFYFNICRYVGYST